MSNPSDDFTFYAADIVKDDTFGTHESLTWIKFITAFNDIDKFSIIPAPTKVLESLLVSIL